MKFGGFVIATLLCLVAMARGQTYMQLDSTQIPSAAKFPCPAAGYFSFDARGNAGGMVGGSPVTSEYQVGRFYYCATGGNSRPTAAYQCLPKVDGAGVVEIDVFFDNQYKICRGKKSVWP